MSLFQAVLIEPEDDKKSPTNSKITNSIVNKILEEYSLKKIKFNPDSPSPNKFNNRLFLRMKKYYSLLYKEDNDNTK
tara:strand:- start:295 stop:525 length:231 start_codon:yes stop_codon:yes gene_type:complete